MSDKTKKIISVTISIISYVIVAIAIIIMVVVMIARINGSQPKLFGYTFHLVVTDSMTPEIAVGDLVIAKECRREDVKIGDDIVFKTQDKNLISKGITTIIHRVVKIEHTSNGIEISTQGIKQGAGVDEMPAGELLGIKVAKSTFFGTALKFLSDIKNLLFLAVFIILLLVAVTLIKKAIFIIKEPQTDSDSVINKQEDNKKIEQEIEELKSKIDNDNNKADTPYHNNDITTSKNQDTHNTIDNESNENIKNNK
ncbi:MAG: signal peptidase I [Clostridia bacterium]